MSQNTLFFYPGFMGNCDELSFLKGHYETIGVDLTQQQISNEIKDAHHYAYSMGGRLLLRELSQKPIEGRLLVLESVGLFNELDPHKLAERRKLDNKRAQAIINDFPSFLEKWYSAPMWNFNKEEKTNKIKQQLKLFNDKKDQLAKTIISYSPSNVQIPQDLGAIFGRFNKVIFLYGERDEKYAKIAQRLKMEYPQVLVISFPDLGHNIHFQRPELITETLLKA